MEAEHLFPDCGSIAKLIEEASTGKDFQNSLENRQTYTGLYHSGNGIRTGRDCYCRGSAVYRHRGADQSDVTSILVLSGESTEKM